MGGQLMCFGRNNNGEVIVHWTISALLCFASLVFRTMYPALPRLPREDGGRNKQAHRKRGMRSMEWSGPLLHANPLGYCIPA